MTRFGSYPSSASDGGKTKFPAPNDRRQGLYIKLLNHCGARYKLLPQLGLGVLSVLNRLGGSPCSYSDGGKQLCFGWWQNNDAGSGRQGLTKPIRANNQTTATVMA